MNYRKLDSGKAWKQDYPWQRSAQQSLCHPQQLFQSVNQNELPSWTLVAKLPAQSLVAVCLFFFCIKISQFQATYKHQHAAHNLSFMLLLFFLCEAILRATNTISGLYCITALVHKTLRHWSLGPRSKCLVSPKTLWAKCVKIYVTIVLRFEL